MEIQVEMKDRAIVVNIEGEIDHHSAEGIREKIDQLYTNTHALDVVFDFEAVTFMDSSGIGMMMGRYKKLKPKGEIKIYNMNPHVKRLVDLSGLNQIIQVYPTLDAALGGK